MAHSNVAGHVAIEGPAYEFDFVKLGLMNRE